MNKMLTHLNGYKREAVLAPLFKMLEATFDLFVPLVMATLEDPTEMRTRAASMMDTRTSGRLAVATALPMTSPRPEFCSI